ncbi:MAG: hypothetical protein NC923_06895 [Candidatus Omnitrophica bacterium]|nr:hypothetical protein [Candidatus Omnitrophota bacterium]
MEQDIQLQKNKFFAVISYMSFFCIVSLVLRRENAFALYHSKNGLILFVLETVSFILSIIPLLGDFIKIGGSIFFISLSLWGIIQALQGNYSRIPIISNIADRIII